MGKDIFFYSISLDPDTDTPEVLKAYKERYKIGDGWMFLTGDRELVDELQSKLGVLLDESDKASELDHNLNLMIGNQATGQWIKRSHLENAQILATLLKQLHQEQKEPLALMDYRKAPTQLHQVSAGEKIFYSRCADCHSIGEGQGLGPDLYKVGDRRSAEWLDRWLEDPAKMIESKDPIAIGLYEASNRIMMPNLRLSADDRRNVLEFIKQESDRRLAKGGELK